MKILVTGAQGLLGREVVAALAGAHVVVAADVAQFDVADLDAMVAACRAARPRALLHCAAFTDVDGCEGREAHAFRVNAVGARNAAIAAVEVGARLIHVSTDYVFNGRSTRPYVESDAPDPLNVYGRSKWQGEFFVREIARDYTIVRTQALYGASGASFVRSILERVRRGEPLAVVDDQTVCPTRSADLAATLLRILVSGGPGTYHASSQGECTWFDFAAAILHDIGRPDHPLARTSTAALARPAPRPAYSVLRNLHLECSIGDTMPHWRDALRTHLGGAR